LYGIQLLAITTLELSEVLRLVVEVETQPEHIATKIEVEAALP
jgi:hypothetical protein